MACSSKCLRRISLDSAMNFSWSNCSAIWRPEGRLEPMRLGAKAEVREAPSRVIKAATNFMVIVRITLRFVSSYLLGGSCFVEKCRRRCDSLSSARRDLFCSIVFVLAYPPQTYFAPRTMTDRRKSRPLFTPWKKSKLYSDM